MTRKLSHDTPNLGPYRTGKVVAWRTDHFTALGRDTDAEVVRSRTRNVHVRAEFHCKCPSHKTGIRFNSMKTSGRYR
ncbi:hypothetical protein PISMIDRAFT_488420 [Pisolithus microcarpus 441]|uniref:Uncharacterized protein n=1 Tax=Pisolithus microcarpus 441 TaxID=765257 RepID=A0A0C9ZUE8_9AGAM|nr:hypothetical protein PISMIDRAFT_488420 [Pisolithus microcarpus 441]